MVKVDERLRKAASDAELYNAREGMLGLPISDYTHVRNLIDQFDPFLQFWTTSAEWRVRVACAFVCVCVIVHAC